MQKVTWTKNHQKQEKRDSKTKKEDQIDDQNAINEAAPGNSPHPTYTQYGDWFLPNGKCVDF